MTTTIRNWVIALSITLALSLITFFFWVMNLGLGEEICFDRHPWWGPPEDPDSTCSGLWYADKHPGEYPWTLPR